MIAIAMVMHHFHPVLEHGLSPSLNLNHNACSIFPPIHVRRESMARKNIGTVYLCQSLVNGLYVQGLIIRKRKNTFKLNIIIHRQTQVKIIESYPGLNTAEVPQFIPREILKILNSCRLKSSCGKDGVFYKDLLDNWEVIQHEVTAICNVLVLSHRVPRDWEHTLIQRIPKKNYDPEDLTTLRDISLLLCLYKVFIKGIVERDKSRIIENTVGYWQRAYISNRDRQDLTFCLKTAIDDFRRSS